MNPHYPHENGPYILTAYNYIILSYNNISDYII